MTPSVALAEIPDHDRVARERVARDLDHTLFVEAGAGTGKTTALVGRIRNLVLAGAVELRHVAAITFTEAAAAQLRDRVRTDLERALRQSELDETARQRCAAALQQVDEAAMLTLHGFAQQVLAEHPLEAGLPPAFEIMDDLAEAELLDQAWLALLDDLLDAPQLTDSMETLLAVDLSLFSLRAVAMAMAQAYDRFDRADVWPQHGSATPDISGLCDQMAQAHDWLQWCQTPDQLSAHLQKVVTLRAQITQATTPAEQWRLLRQTKLSTTRGQKANWGGHAAEIKAGLIALEQDRVATLDAVAHAALVPVFEHLRQWAVQLADQRRREGRLTFHDLLVGARNLLRDHESVRSATVRRWQRLLIDEFQDTDPLQAEIALCLAGTQPGSVDPGRLFFVGDPKQSIYRFRRADIAIYRMMQERFADGVVQLSTSFRTVPSTVDWVNAVFAPVLDGAVGQAAFHPLSAARPSGDHEFTVRTLGGAHEAATVEELRARESEDVAKAICAVREEAWQVCDSGQWRAARFADIAVLLPTRTALADLERAFERHQVPYRVEASSLVYGSAEVTELIAVLRAIDDPTDDLAIVSALRSPGLACPDDALARWKHAGHGWDYRQLNAAQHHDAPELLPVVEGLAALKRWHAQRRLMDPAALLDRLLAELNLFQLALGRSRPRDSWRRMRFVMSEARAFAERGGTLRELVWRFERQAADEIRVTEQVLPDEDDDAVRILTIHAAKGLEFPITVLAGLGVRTNVGTGNVLLWDDQGDPQAKCGEVQTAGYQAAKESEQHAAAQERARLLYVAATRARDHLIVALYHKPTRDGSPTAAETLCGLLPAAEGLWQPWEPAAAPASSGKAVHLTPPDSASDDGWDGDVDHWQRQRDHALARGPQSAVVAATTLVSVLDEEPLPPYRRGRTGTAIGRAVHAVLQTIDLSDPDADAVQHAAAAQAEAEGVGERGSEIAARVRSALRSDPVREAVASGKFWREVPVAARVDGGMVEGFLDLVYRAENDELVIVDYKTDAAMIPESLERYRLQLGVYAFALQSALGSSVQRAALVMTDPRGPVVHWLADPEAAATEAQALAEQHFTPATR